MALYSRGVTLTECVNSWFEATGKKQNVVAERAGIAPTKISEIVNGRNPDPQWSTVEKIARGFGLTLSEFVAGPRPEGESGRVGTTEGNSVLASVILAGLDADTPAEDSWRGDVLKAIAVLNRALRRQATAGDAAGGAAKAGR